MIEGIPICWTAAGLLAGLLHAAMLRHATTRLTAWTPLLGAVRLAAVAAVLAAAAIQGEILAAAAGWTAGFAGLSLWIATRRDGAAAAPKSGGGK